MLGHVGSNQVVVGQRVERLASRELLDATSQMLDATELEPLTATLVATGPQ